LHLPRSIPYVVAVCRRSSDGTATGSSSGAAIAASRPTCTSRRAAEAKVWLDPVALATAVDLRNHEINAILRKVNEQKSAFLKAWHDHFRR
jgi:hypothetical protein